MSSDLAAKICKLLEKDHDISTIYLFGSHAKAIANATSDVDVAILYDSTCVPDAQAVLALQEKLAGHLQVERVDLVVLNRANPILKYQIFRYGQCLLNRNPRHQRSFLVRTMTEYADLKRSRAPIERALLKGRVYGR